MQFPLPPPAPHPPVRPDGDRARGDSSAGHYWSAIGVGALYMAVMVGLYFWETLSQSYRDQPGAWILFVRQLHYADSLPLNILAFVIIVGWVTLVCFRARLADALSATRKTALYNGLLTLSIIGALLLSGAAIAPIGYDRIETFITRVFFQSNLAILGILVRQEITATSLLLLAMFSFGAAFGLRWAPGSQQSVSWRKGMLAATMGWIGSAAPLALVNVGLGVLIETYRCSPTAREACELGAGIFLFLFLSIIQVAVLGLLAALTGGALGGMMRQTLRPPASLSTSVD